jgi:magnesium chelatase family protein
LGVIVFAAVPNALSTTAVRIECNFGRGFAGIQLLGNVGDICRHGKERAMAALEHAGIKTASRRVFLSISPADVRVDGAQLDLAFVVSLLALLKPDSIQRNIGRTMFIGEIALSGELRTVKGLISYALAAVRGGFEQIILPRSAERTIAVLKSLDTELFKNLKFLVIDDLGGLLQWLGGQDKSINWNFKNDRNMMRTGEDFSDMYLDQGQRLAAMTVAAGQHSILLTGVPGTGKSMFARRLISLMPQMSGQEHLTSLELHNLIYNDLPPLLLNGIPPFRTPHHQASVQAVLGTTDIPGEMSLAHGGLLFLDELPEFRRDLIESMRQPLESGMIHLARAQRKVRWPARTMLIAAANHCPCGWAQSAYRRCNCTTSKIQNYRNKLSGPILDRIDLHVEFCEKGESSALILRNIDQDSNRAPNLAMKQTVHLAREFAVKRNIAHGFEAHQTLGGREILRMEGENRENILSTVAEVIPAWISSRTIIKVLRVARTVADLELRAHIQPQDLQTAWGWQRESKAQPQASPQENAMIAQAGIALHEGLC